MAKTPPRRIPAEDVTDLYRSLQETSVHVWIDGGWAVDALVGEQTRDHGNLDIAVLCDPLPTLRGLLLARGYRNKGEVDPRR